MLKFGTSGRSFAGTASKIPASASEGWVSVKRPHISSPLPGDAKALQRLGAPDIRAAVILLEHRNPVTEVEPGQLRRGVDVNVRRQRGGRIQRADPDEAEDRRAEDAPEVGSANPAAHEAKRRAGRGRHLDLPGHSGEKLDPVVLDPGIEREGGSRQTLAPGAMAAMNDERSVGKPEADSAAGAAAFHVVLPESVAPPADRRSGRVTRRW